LLSRILNILLVNWLFWVLVQSYQELQIRCGYTKDASRFQNPITFFEHIGSLLIIQMFKQMFGKDKIERSIRKREWFSRIQIDSTPTFLKRNTRI